MRGSQYKDKEGVEMFLGKSYVNASFTLSGVTLTRGFTVVFYLTKSEVGLIQTHTVLRLFTGNEQICYQTKGERLLFMDI